MPARGLFAWLSPEELARLPLVTPNVRGLGWLLKRAAGEFEGLRLECVGKGPDGKVWRLVKAEARP